MTTDSDVFFLRNLGINRYPPFVRKALNTIADRLESLITQTEDARTMVREQAEDDGLWFIADSVVEAYFQQEIRRLHATIENKPKRN